MASANKTAPEEETKNELVAQTGGTALSADFLDEIAADAGAGTSRNADDNVVPFIALLQDMSPQAKKRDPNYIDGAEPGFLLNKATRGIFDITKSVADGGDEFLVQPCAFHRCVVEWIPRDAGGGFVARHDTQPGQDIDDLLSKLGKQIVDPKDSTGKKKIWVTPDGKHELRDTRYHYVNILMEDGSLFPAVMSFSSTGHTASREWMTLMNNFKIKVGDRLITAPSWAKKYRVRSKVKTNTSGDFFVLYIEDAGVIEDKAVREQGKLLNKAFESGEVKADVEDESGEGTASSAGQSGGGDKNQGDIPI